VHQQALFTIRTKARISVKNKTVFSPRGKQIHDFEGELAEFRQVLLGCVCDKNKIEVGAIVDLRAAQFAQADDHKWRRFQLVLSHRDFDRVLQTGIGKRRKFREILLWIGKAEDVTQPNAHEFRLMIASEPQFLVLITNAMAKVE